jgi:hypothetical protein
MVQGTGPVRVDVAHRDYPGACTALPDALLDCLPLAAPLLACGISTGIEHSKNVMTNENCRVLVLRNVSPAIAFRACDGLLAR